MAKTARFDGSAFFAVTTGSIHACAIRVNGTLACWGDNAHDETDAPTGTYKDLAVGYYHDCAIATDGAMTCWPRTPDGVEWADTGS